jgi:acyl transferase domain-containing protein
MISDAEATDPIVWMFPGQGVQYFQMGRALYDGNDTFRSWIDRLDAVAADHAGESIARVLYGGEGASGQPFGRLLHTHPALFMVQYALARTLLAEGFPAPQVLLGASLGEFMAAAVSGAVAPETVLADIIKQARLFEAHCSGGAMLLVLDDVGALQTNPTYAQGCELAAINFDGCFVLSGRDSAIAGIAMDLERQDIVNQLLPVPVAFHSSYIDGLEGPFIQAFSNWPKGNASIPVISCAPQANADRVSPAYWWHIIRRPIECQRAILAVERDHPRAIYVDLGPSGNMATFAKYNLPPEARERIVPIMTPFGRDIESIETARGRLYALQQARAG